ncbi:hypothetical protein CDV31_015106 [Fusarium ambrosium]|uniref:Uncharacterized protein n=1 Tax=Fusarium ambrosium TaxID=131363 RepID=A0A428SS06_9HYPO|nr:hypothetical protein CDV31_015106 [Fusarium ambrosium]
MSSSEPTSFLHLPPEIRNLVYDLAFNPDVKANILNAAHTGYTREASPLLYVHPVISADLRERAYTGDFSLVLPIQEPSEWVKGRGLDCEKLKTYLDNLPGLMKKKCERLIVEASQSDEAEEENYEFWDSKDFPSYLIPLLLQIKEEIPTLNKITFIFWFGELSAPPNVWKKSLRLLSRQWSKKTQNQNADKGLTVKSSRGKPSITMQFNLFDYYDPDGGDTGANGYLMWYCFAGHERPEYNDEDGSEMDDEDGDEGDGDDGGNSDDNRSQDSDEVMSEDDDENEDEDEDYDHNATAKSLGLKFTFKAMDLHWEDHVKGNFEGKEFDPNVWDDIYFHTMTPDEKDRAAHKYWYITQTCKPLFVKTASGLLS